MRNRHEEVGGFAKYFQDFARDVVRTSKSGNMNDMAIGTKLSSKIEGLYYDAEQYEEHQ